MIRRDVPEGHLLITQHDHALLAGQLARQVGNASFSSLADEPAALVATDLHDCGWSAHDEAPTLNATGLPLDVFESPPEITLPAWTQGVHRAAAASPYAGLLVSLHVLNLSLLPSHSAPNAHRRFALNKFHHAQFEAQDALRRTLGLRIDRPLTHGLQEPHVDPAEDRLRFHFRWLQALDQISLALCCTTPPVTATTELHPHPGAKPLTLSLECVTDRVLRVSPWPFDMDVTEVTAPARLVPPGPYADAERFHRTYVAAAVRELQLRLVR